MDGGVVLAESGAVVEYLVDCFGTGTGLSPERYPVGMEGKVGGETEGWRRYRFFMHYAEVGALFPPFFWVVDVLGGEWEWRVVG